MYPLESCACKLHVFATLFLLALFTSCNRSNPTLISGTASVTHGGAPILSEALNFPTNQKQRRTKFERLGELLLKDHFVDNTPILAVSMECPFGLGVEVPANVKNISKASTAIFMQFTRLADGSVQLNCGISEGDMREKARQMNGGTHQLVQCAVDHFEEVYDDLASIGLGRHGG